MDISIDRTERDGRHDNSNDRDPGSGPASPAASISPADQQKDRMRTGLAALAGVLAGAAALSTGELVASFVAPNPGPVIAVANRVIDNAPVWFVEFGKTVFGLADKPALVVGTILISLVLAAGFGVLSLRRRVIGIYGIYAFGLLGMLSIGSDAQGSWPMAIVTSVLAVGAGTGVLMILLSKLTNDSATIFTGRSTAEVGLRSPALDATPVNPPVSRRGFLNFAGVVGVTAAVAAAGSRELRARSAASAARDSVQLTATPTGPFENLVAEANRGPVASTRGITPLVVPNDDFYRIDTALTTPQVDPATWSLTIKGMVDNELSVSYDDLLARAETVAPVTLSCVSNAVGGDLVGNAIWQGVPLSELLEEAGVQPGATQIASRSVDGWDCGFPTEAAFDGRTALVAIGMNGEPLPIRHGFPARLVVSGLYGYVSATKWLSEIELTTIEDFDGYWIPRGWSKLGPIKTQSRIDTPRTGAQFQAGETVPLAGVAWAPDSGIAKVEVLIDDGEWQEAELGVSLGPDAWIQWLLPWTATSGRHVIQVRATDNTGETQTEIPTPPAPNGASGWHKVGIEVA